MSKCGIIMRDPQTEEHKIKLYKDKEGNLKGDGLCCYLKVSGALKSSFSSLWRHIWSLFQNHIQKICQNLKHNLEYRCLFKRFTPEMPTYLICFLLCNLTLCLEMAIIPAEHVSTCSCLGCQRFWAEMGGSSPFTLKVCHCVTKNTEVSSQEWAYCSPVFAAFNWELVRFRTFILY